MKKLFTFLICTLFFYQIQAQVRFGIRGGINTINAGDELLTIVDEIGDELFEVGLNNTKIGPVGGLVIQAQIGKFLIQPELLISSNRYEYQVIDLTDPNAVAELRDESYQYFDIPLLLGFKLGPLRLQAGPEAHVYVNSTSDLIDLDFYRENIDNFTFGWVGNIGIDIWEMMLDVRYEGNLTKLGSSFEIGDQVLLFDDRPNRWVFSLSYLF